MNIAYYNQDGFTIPLAQSLPQVVVIDSALVSVHTIELPRMSKSKLIDSCFLKISFDLIRKTNNLSKIMYKFLFLLNSQAPIFGMLLLLIGLF